MGSPDVRYLTRFVQELWPTAAELLGAVVTHEAVEAIEPRLPRGTRITNTRTRVDLSRPPAFRPTADGLQLRIPADGAHTFRTRIYLTPKGGWPRILPEVDLAFRAMFTADREPEVEVDVDVDTNITGWLADLLFDWRDQIHEELDGGDLNEQLGFFSTARYDRDAVPEIPAPVLRYPDRPVLGDAVNLVLVADRFRDETRDTFDTIVDAVVDRLTSTDEARRNEPFHSFKTALQVWTITPPQAGDHTVASSSVSGSARVSLGNLARIAAIGRRAEEVGPGQTVVAYIADRGAYSTPPRAMALGPMIMQPTEGDPAADAYDPDADVTLLLHELGHSPLGNLADEYLESSAGYDTAVYRGQPRSAPNITSDESLVLWDRWLDRPSELPDWDEHPVVGVEGGGYFGLGIWRPAHACMMRDRRSGAPFCAVCREALTRGLRAALPAGQHVLRIEHNGRSENVELVTGDGDEAAEGLVTLPSTGSHEFAVTLLASTVPEPWNLRATLEGDGTVRSTRRRDLLPTLTRTWEVSAQAGDRLLFDVGSRCPFTPWDEPARHRLALLFELDPERVDPPATPSGVSGRQTSRNPAGTPQPIRLTATTAEPAGQDVRLQFEITRSGQSFQGRISASSGWLDAPAGRNVTASVSHRVSMQGSYEVRARAQNRSGRNSAWSPAARFTAEAQRGGGDDHVHDPVRPPVDRPIPVTP